MVGSVKGSSISCSDLLLLCSCGLAPDISRSPRSRLEQTPSIFPAEGGYCRNLSTLHGRQTVLAEYYPAIIRSSLIPFRKTDPVRRVSAIADNLPGSLLSAGVPALASNHPLLDSGAIVAPDIPGATLPIAMLGMRCNLPRKDFPVTLWARKWRDVERLLATTFVSRHLFPVSRAVPWNVEITPRLQLDSYPAPTARGGNPSALHHGLFHLFPPFSAIPSRKGLIFASYREA